MPSDEDRARRLIELKRAIQAGTYDERQLFERLLNHIDDGLTERDVSAEDDSQS